MMPKPQSDLGTQGLLWDWSGRRSFEKYWLNVKQLVLLTDLTKESEHAVDYALSLAQYFQAKLTLLYIFAPLTVREAYFCVPSINAERGLLRLEAATRLKHTQCDACFRCGRYAEEAFKVAEERSADLIVVAESNLSWFRYFLHSDYRGKYVLDAPCPLVVVTDQPAIAPRPGE
jgi:nucleotide-binding universal stress UspA family protein